MRAQLSAQRGGADAVFDGDGRRVGIELSVNVASASAGAMETELMRILADLGLDSHVRIDRS